MKVYATFVCGVEIDDKFAKLENVHLLGFDEEENLENEIWRDVMKNLGEITADDLFKIETEDGTTLAEW